MSGRGWALFLAMGVIWGVPYLMIKVAVDGGISVPMVVFARTALGALVLLPLALRSGPPTWLRTHWRPLTLFAVLEILIPWALLADAERHLTSSLTGLLIAAAPIMAVFVARAAGDAERLTRQRWIGLALGFGGVAVLAAPELRGDSPVAIVEVVVVAVCYACGPVVVARRLQDVPSLSMTAVCLSGAALVYTVPAVLTWPRTMPEAPVLASLAGLGLLCTALAFVLFFALIREVGPARALVITYVNPAVAIAAGVLLLGEPLTVTIVTAFALILAGSGLAMSRRVSSPSGSDPASHPS